MSWIEEVRKDLEYIKDAPIGTGIRLQRRAAKALAAIPDEDPMQKLLNWLRDNYNLDNHMVIDYIKKELGYGNGMKDELD